MRKCGQQFAGQLQLLSALVENIAPRSEGHCGIAASLKHWSSAARCFLPSCRCKRTSLSAFGRFRMQTSRTTCADTSENHGTLRLIPMMKKAIVGWSLEGLRATAFAIFLISLLFFCASIRYGRYGRQGGHTHKKARADQFASGEFGVHGPRCHPAQPEGPKHSLNPELAHPPPPPISLPPKARPLEHQPPFRTRLGIA